MLVDSVLNTSELSEDAINNVYPKVYAKDFIAHHGVKGQKWGIRRFQNSDGSLTPEGRTHYGVGSSLKKAGSAIGKAAGKTVRKALHRQTDEELDAEYQKAQKRNERRAKQKYIDESKGKRKPLHKMNDDELNEYIDRLTKERNVKKMEKELKEMNRGPAKKMISSLADNAVAGIGEGLKRGIAGKIETSMRKNEERKQTLKDKAFEEKHRNASEKLQKQKNDSQNALDIVRNNAEKKALLGNETYAKQLERVAAAKKGNKPESDQGKRDAQNARDAAIARRELDAMSDDPKVRREANRILDQYRKSNKGNRKKNHSS